MRIKMIKAMKNKNMQSNKVWSSAVQLMLLSFVLLFSQLTLAKDRIQYHVQNFDGSTLKVINEQGVVSQSYQYAPFGQQLQYKKPSNLKNPNAFVGGVQDADDLVYLKQRHYNSVLGRFYQPDPVTFIMKGHGQTNRYQYGWNDTYTFSDPTGNWAEIRNGVWVENGKSFYTTSGGAFTDKISENFGSDWMTLAVPASKLGLLSKFKTPSISDELFAWGARLEQPALKELYVLEKNMPKTLAESGLNFQYAGQEIIKWGAGSNDALFRTMFLTTNEAKLILKQVPPNDIRAMRDFYIRIANILPKDKVLATPTPLMRAGLMDQILKLGLR